MKKIFLALVMVLGVASFAVAASNFVWTAPTTNVDGTLLTDLAGYKLYCGLSSGNYPSIKDIGMLPTNIAGEVVYPIANMLNIDITKTHYCVVTAKDINGNESNYSNEVSIPLVGIAPNIPAAFGVK